MKAMAALILVCLIAALAATEAARADEPAAEKLKAAFILNFLKFTEWPASAFESPEAPVRVAIADNPSMAQVVKAITANERAAGRPIVVEMIDLEKVPAEELRRYHAVHFGHGARERYRERLRALAGHPVLTIGSEAIRGFAESGGMLGLVPQNGRLGFEANPEEMKKAGVTVSSKVLRLARIVKTREE